jgi:vacuolar-type H+-ATPase subunit I/STV1
MGKMGLSLDNPAVLATANVISALTNIPTDRVVMKLTNIKDATMGDFENWQRISMLMGINKWSLGEYEDSSDDVKEKIKRDKERDKSYKKLKEKHPSKSDQEINEIIKIEKKTKSIYKLTKKEQETIIRANIASYHEIRAAMRNEDKRVKAILKMIETGKIDGNFNTISDKNYSITEGLRTK